MKLNIKIWTSDMNAVFEILEGENVAGIKIDDLAHEPRIIFGEIGPISTNLFSFVIYVEERVALPVASSFIAKLLSDKLKEREDNKLEINDKSVKINSEKIKQLIIEFAKEKEIE